MITVKKPCPFCGGKHYEKTGYDTGKVACDNRDCPIGTIAMRPEQWEKRYLETKYILNGASALKFSLERLQLFWGLSHRRMYGLLGSFAL